MEAKSLVSGSYRLVNWIFIEPASWPHNYARNTNPWHLLIPRRRQFSHYDILLEDSSVVTSVSDRSNVDRLLNAHSV